MAATSGSRSGNFLRRRKGLLLGLIAIGLLAVAGLGVRELVQRYPNQGFLSAERLNDALVILLGTDVRLDRYQPEPVLQVERRTGRACELPCHRCALAPGIAASGADGGTTGCRDGRSGNPAHRSSRRASRGIQEGGCVCRRSIRIASSCS